MRARDVVDRASITGVWAALGGGELRHHGRGRAWWRDGDGYSIALGETKSCWYDHAHGSGGGVLDLIQVARDCDRRDALRWFADHLGVTLDDRQPLTRDEKSHYAQRRSLAESKAQNLTAWRRDTLRRLRDDRNRLNLSENMISAAARTLLAATGGEGNDEAWAPIFEHALDDHRADQIVREIRRIKRATPAELVSSAHAWEVA